jgi:hypothetical protein
VKQRLRVHFRDRAIPRRLRRGKVEFAAGEQDPRKVVGECPEAARGWFDRLNSAVETLAHSVRHALPEVAQEARQVTLQHLRLLATNFDRQVLPVAGCH